MKLVVYLPALNEGENIGAVLDAIPRDIEGIDEVQTLVVDDGSTDDTAEVARRHGALVVRHRRNRGTGRAFLTGVESALEAGADLIVGMDSDGQFNPNDIPVLIAPILSGKADVALCTRFGGVPLDGTMPAGKRLGNKALSRVVSYAARQRFTDVSCGFRAYTREAALRAAVYSDYEYVHESLLNWSRHGFALVEVPLRVRAQRAVGESRIMGSLLRYAIASGPVLVRAIRDHSPLRFFGAISLVVLLPALFFGGWVSVHWLLTKQTEPYTSMIPISVGGVILAFLLLNLGLLADLIARLRFQVEEVLYDARRRGMRRDDGK